MKLFVYLLMGVLLLSVIGLFVLKKPNGDSWLSISDVTDTSTLTHELESIKNNVVSTTKSLLEGEQQPPEIFKWQDSNGVWHYSDKKPENNGSIKWDVPENLTVIPAIKPLNQKDKLNQSHNQSTTEQHDSIQQPNKIKKLIDDANNVQNLMDDRMKKIDEQL